MNTLLLRPTDILFFRDGRPMEGSLAGHGAAWPLPNVTDAAFHAALHRSGLEGHAHDQRTGQSRLGKDNRQFGSLVCAGPFPVHFRAPSTATWFFPRPLDLLDNTLKPALAPTDRFSPGNSSLPKPTKYAVANSLAPSKDKEAKSWLRADAYQDYLEGKQTSLAKDQTLNDADFSDAEATIGITIDRNTGVAGQGEAAGKIYSARYLRLREDWHLGTFAQTQEKHEQTGQPTDLIPNLLSQPSQILVGGQQRLCTATRLTKSTLPLPQGKLDGFASHTRDGEPRWLVKWILLSPAIWPEIPAISKDGQPMTPHCGGWLPNWVRQVDGQVMLKSGQRQRRRYGGKHTRGYSEDSAGIQARLVAAIVPKPIPVTGWTLANEKAGIEAGAKSTHLAVPAGAVYYFEAATAADADKLAAALNWHGSDTAPTTIHNRRSTLMGEKGFGLGVCSTWNFHDVHGRPNP
jgi:CRISPR-associated protein Cmr3